MGYTVAVNGETVKKYVGHSASAFQVATNHAYDLHEEYKRMAEEVDPAYGKYVVTVNGKNIVKLI